MKIRIDTFKGEKIMRKSFVKVVTLTAALSMLASSTAFAGQWKQENSTWKYQNDDGSYITNNWQWIDGKSYCFDSNGNMYANTTTPDGYTVNTDGQWTVDGVIQTQNANNATATTSDEYPLKGRVEKYLGNENGFLCWYWTGPHVILEGIVPEGMTGLSYVDQRAIEDRDPSYSTGLSQYGIDVLAKLSGYPYKNSVSDKPEATALLHEVKAFMNSFDWRNASDLEKATRICERIHQASYDHDAANEAYTTGWSESPSYGAYGCLVNGKAVCQGYTEAAHLLGFAVGVKSRELGDVGHTYPVFLVDGIWLGNEPTMQNKYFTVEDVYRKNILGKYQLLGQYCEATGYVVPTDKSMLSQFGILGETFGKTTIDFKSEYK